MIFYWFTATKLTNHYETYKHLLLFLDLFTFATQ